MIQVPQGPFGGNRRSPVVGFSQSEFITMGMQQYTASATKRWTRILDEKYDRATIQGLKISGWSDSTMKLGVINVTCLSSHFDGSGNTLASAQEATSLMNYQTSGDSTLYEKWTIQIAATSTTHADKKKSVFWIDFTDAQKLYSFAMYDQLYIDIAVTFSGGNAIELNPQLEVLPFLAD